MKIFVQPPLPKNQLLGDTLCSFYHGGAEGEEGEAEARAEDTTQPNPTELPLLLLLLCFVWIG